MKTIRAKILPITTLICICIFTCGCEESNLSNRRARLVGNENLKLKKQLKLCDKEIEKRDDEIQKQKDLLAQCQKEKAEIDEQAGDTNIKLLKILRDTSKKVDELTEENQKLKETIKELEAAIGQ